MRVYFHNNYTTTVWVAIMQYDTDACGGHGGDWATRGWWRIEPGQEVWAFSTTNEYCCAYAEAADGAVWSGDYGPVYVYQHAFDSCVNIGASDAIDEVGMFLMDLPWYRWNPIATHTVWLNP